LKLKKPLKFSLLGKYIYKKTTKKTKNQKTHWAGFFLNLGFFQPCSKEAFARPKYIRDEIRIRKRILLSVVLGKG
jgi:hypothetical protein